MPPTRSALSPAGYEALAEFRYAIARFLGFSARAAGQVGLAPRQHQALLAVKGFSGPELATIKVLAERLQMRHNSAVGLVDRLARRGLVRRVPDRDDQRVVRIRLTSRGHGIIARLSAAHRNELHRVGPELRHRLTEVIGEPGKAS